MPETTDFAHIPTAPRAVDPSAVTVLAWTSGGCAVLPPAYPLGRAAYFRLGRHLLVRARGFPDVIVPRFCTDAGQSMLATPDGRRFSRQLVLVMASLSRRVEMALDGVGRTTEA